MSGLLNRAHHSGHSKSYDLRTSKRTPAGHLYLRCNGHGQINPGESTRSLYLPMYLGGEGGRSLTSRAMLR